MRAETDGDAVSVDLGAVFASVNGSSESAKHLLRHDMPMFRVHIKARGKN